MASNGCDGVLCKIWKSSRAKGRSHGCPLMFSIFMGRKKELKNGQYILYILIVSFFFSLDETDSLGTFTVFLVYASVNISDSKTTN